MSFKKYLSLLILSLFLFSMSPLAFAKPEIKKQEIAPFSKKLPDLVIDNIEVNDYYLDVTIKNIGNGYLPLRTKGEFSVELYDQNFMVIETSSLGFSIKNARAIYEPGGQESFQINFDVRKDDIAAVGGDIESTAQELDSDNVYYKEETEDPDSELHFALSGDDNIGNINIIPETYDIAALVTDVSTAYTGDIISDELFSVFMDLNLKTIAGNPITYDTCNYENLVNEFANKVNDLVLYDGAGEVVTSRIDAPVANSGRYYYDYDDSVCQVENLRYEFDEKFILNDGDKLIVGLDVDDPSNNEMFRVRFDQMSNTEYYEFEYAVNATSLEDISSEAVSPWYTIKDEVTFELSDQELPLPRLIDDQNTQIAWTADVSTVADLEMTYFTLFLDAEIKVDYNQCSRYSEDIIDVLNSRIVDIYLYNQDMNPVSFRSELDYGSYIESVYFDTEEQTCIVNNLILSKSVSLFIPESNGKLAAAIEIDITDEGEGFRLKALPETKSNYYSMYFEETDNEPSYLYGDLLSDWLSSLIYQ